MLLIIVASVVVTLVSVEFVIIEPVPRIVTLVRVEEDIVPLVIEPPKINELFDTVDVAIVVFWRKLRSIVLPVSVDVATVEFVDVELTNEEEATVDVAINEPNTYE